ncbi:MAG TPA: MarR family transcriptional regulator [Hyphomicrobiaceae bacterium]|jgi:DNA-binding MarR family transcriptional regulator
MSIEPQPTSEVSGLLRLRLWVRLLRAVRPIEAELRRRLAHEFGVTLPKFDVMAALARREAGMTMTEVSRFLMVSNGNVTGLVNRLVAEGLVVRVANRDDRRATFVRLTRKGVRLFETMAGAHERWVNEILSTLSDEQSETMIGLLDTVRKEARLGGRSR